MHAYRRLILLKNLPISYFLDTQIRLLSKHDVFLSKQTFKEILFKLVDIVEDEISAEMRSTISDAVMQDE